MVKFSIIMPVYNAAKYLRAALDSVLAQTYSEWECVCVDDGSRDESGQILDEYAAEDCRFKVVHQKNGGEGAARNSGLDIATGDWITCLDADDMYSPDRLEKFATIILNESPDLVRFGLTFVDETCKRPLQQLCTSNKVEIFCENKAKMWGWYVLAPRGLSCSWAADRRLLQGVRFRTDMRVKVDSIFCGSLANHLEKVVACDYITYFYRQVPTSAIHSAHSCVDVVNLLTAVKDLWDKERDCDATKVAMEKWFRAHCDAEVFDWIESASDLTKENISLVRSKIADMVCIGVFGVLSPRGFRGFAMKMFEERGWILPIKAFHAYIYCGRRIKKSIRRIVE